MDNNYMISVVGIQEVDGEKESVEVITEGDITFKNGHTYISYREYDSENPEKYSHNLVKVEENGKVTIIRKGEIESRLILEEGKRNQCYYRTIAGNLMIGIFTESISNNLYEKGGTLRMKYSVDFNNDFVSNNEIKLEIKEKIKD